MTERRESNATSFCSEYNSMPNPDYDFFIRQMVDDSVDQNVSISKDRFSSENYNELAFVSQTQSSQKNINTIEKFQNAWKKLDLAQKEISENLISDNAREFLNDAQMSNETLETFRKMHGNECSDKNQQDIVKKINSVKLDLVKILSNENANQNEDHKTETEEKSPRFSDKRSKMRHTHSGQSIDSVNSFLEKEARYSELYNYTSANILIDGNNTPEKFKENVQHNFKAGSENNNLKGAKLMENVDYNFQEKTKPASYNNQIEFSKKKSIGSPVQNRNTQSINTNFSGNLLDKAKDKDEYAQKREEVWLMFHHLDQTFAQFTNKTSETDNKSKFEKKLKSVLENDLKNINIHLHSYYDKDLTDKVQTLQRSNESPNNKIIEDEPLDFRNRNLDQNISNNQIRKFNSTDKFSHKPRVYDDNFFDSGKIYERVNSAKNFSSLAKSDYMTQNIHQIKSFNVLDQDEKEESPRSNVLKAAEKDLPDKNTSRKNILELTQQLKSSNGYKQNDQEFPSKSNIYKRKSLRNSEFNSKKDTTYRSKMLNSGRDHKVAPNSYNNFLVERSLNIKDYKQKKTGNQMNVEIEHNDPNRSQSSINVTSPSSTYYSTRTDNVHNIHNDLKYKSASRGIVSTLKKLRGNKSINIITSLNLSPNKIPMCSFDSKNYPDRKTSKDKGSKNEILNNMVKPANVISDILHKHKSLNMDSIGNDENMWGSNKDSKNSRKKKQNNANKVNSNKFSNPKLNKLVSNYQLENSFKLQESSNQENLPLYESQTMDIPSEFFKKSTLKEIDTTKTDKILSKLYKSDNKQDLQSPSIDQRSVQTTNKKKKTYSEMHNEHKKSSNLSSTSRKFQRLNTCRSSDKKLLVLPEDKEASNKSSYQRSATTREKKNMSSYRSQSLKKRQEKYQNVIDERYGYAIDDNKKFEFKDGYVKEEKKLDNVQLGFKTLDNPSKFKPEIIDRLKTFQTNESLQVDSKISKNQTEESIEDKNDYKIQNFEKLDDKNIEYINNYLRRTESNKTNTQDEKISIKNASKDLDQKTKSKSSSRRNLDKPEQADRMFIDLNSEHEKTLDSIELYKDALPRKYSSPKRFLSHEINDGQDVETDLKEAQNLIDNLKKFFDNSPFNKN